MIERTCCPKCESRRIIPDADVRSEAGPYSGEFTVKVCEHPNAFLFTGSHYGNLRAWICGTCGYTELYVKNADELYAAYEVSQQK